MKLRSALNFFFLICIAIENLTAQIPPAIEWQKCLGGLSEEAAYCVQEVSTGGFIVAGVALSPNGDVVGNHSFVHGDYWIVKLDYDGNIEWQKCLGGVSEDYGTFIEETADGDFIIAGYALSNDGDVSGNHGGADYWVVKIDAAGNLLWQKTLGGSGDDYAWGLDLTTDGGYIVTGYSNSNDGDVSGNNGGFDYWTVKVDSAGSIEWQKSLGGSGTEEGSHIQQTADGGYIQSGISESTDGDVTGNHGSYDYWFVKLDAHGNLEWQKSLGGSGSEKGYHPQRTFVLQTSEGSYIGVGRSKSSDGDVTYNLGGYDSWIVKLDPAGNLLWQNSIGGFQDDAAVCLQETLDGNLIITGSSSSNNGDLTGAGNHGNGDYWIMKLDTGSNLLWQKCLGGSNWDNSHFIQPTFDGGFIVVGESTSNDGDVSGLNGYFGDYWIVKLTSDMPTDIAPYPENYISLYPNPVQDELIVELVNPANEVTADVYDLQGRMIALPISVSEKIVNNGHKTLVRINLTSLTDGIYILQILERNTGKITLEKFVKAE